MVSSSLASVFWAIKLERSLHLALPTFQIALFNSVTFTLALNIVNVDAAQALFQISSHPLYQGLHQHQHQGHGHGKVHL